MILEDGAEHQSSLDTALAQPQAQDLVRKFIGDVSCRSVEDQADSWVIIRVPPISVFPLSSPIPVLNVLPSPPSSILVERTGSREDDQAGAGEVGEEKEAVVFNITTTVTYTQVIRLLLHFAISLPP